MMEYTINIEDENVVKHIEEIARTTLDITPEEFIVMQLKLIFSPSAQ